MFRTTLIPLLSLVGACGGTDLTFLSYTHEDIGLLANLHITDSIASMESTSDNLTTDRFSGTLTAAGRAALADATASAEAGWDPSAYGCPGCNTFESLTFEEGYEQITVVFSPAHVPAELLPLVTRSHEIVDAFMRCRSSELVVQETGTCQ
jgi:hypothetical protein